MKPFFQILLSLIIATTSTAYAGSGHDHDDHAEHGDHEVEDMFADADEHDEHAHEGEVTLTPAAIRRHGIEVGEAGMHVLSATFTAPARVAFNDEAMAHVGSPVVGRAVQIKARVGDAVKEGDELLVVESVELGEAQAELLARRAAAAAASAAVEPARLAYERATSLFNESGGIALAEVQKREAEAKAAQSEARSRQAAADAIANKLRLLGMTEAQIAEMEQTGRLSARHVVRAPLAGQVIEREVTLGELVSPEREPLLVLADLTTLWVWADVPEARIGEVKVGGKARVHVAASTKTYEGKVSLISPSLNADTRTARVRIDVPGNDETLRPGMFARAEISASDAAGEPVLAVPESAIQSIEGEPVVFVPVEDEPNTFARRDVSVGRPIGGMVPILSGLEDGEHVVISGTFILKAELGKSGATHQH